jgi:hypothetical protein
MTVTSGGIEAMFTISRHNHRVFVSGHVKIKFDWAPKPEWLDAGQIGIFNVLEQHGFSLFHPTEKGDIQQGGIVECATNQIAEEVEKILIKRVEGWVESNQSCVSA